MHMHFIFTPIVSPKVPSLVAQSIKHTFFFKKSPLIMEILKKYKRVGIII